MELPFSKIVVDSRHAASGDASNFDITVPESLTPPPNAVCYCTDIAIAHLFPSLGSGPSLRNAFYWVERIGDTSSSLDYLNRALLDEAKTYTAIGLAAEIQAKVNAASVLGGGYTVTYQEDSGTMSVARPREADTANSFWLVDDDLLRDASFQQLFATVTTPSLTPYTLNYNAPQSCMQLLGLGRRSSRNTSYATLYLATLQDFLLTEFDTGAVDVRRTHSLCLHSPNLTNYKCVGPAGSRSILARVNVTSGYGSILHQQHSGHVLDYTPCGGVTLQTIRFELRNADNEPVDLRGGHASFTLLFADAPHG